MAVKVKGLEIEIAIAEKGLNRAQFCRTCDIRPQTLSAALKRRRTTMLTLVKIAKALDRTVTDFIVMEEE